MSQQSNNPYANSGVAVIDESRLFQTVDLYTPIQSMDGQMLLAADNMSNAAGDLIGRPGRVGRYGGSQSSSSNNDHVSGTSSSSSSAYQDDGFTYYGVPPGASYDITDYTDGQGYHWMLFTSGGKLYKTQQGTNSYTELLTTTGSSFAINSATVDSCTIGNYVYISDNVNPWVRVSLLGGFPVVAMIAPVDAPTVALTDLVIDTPTASQWNPGPTPNNVLTTTSGTFSVPSTAISSGLLESINNGSSFIGSPTPVTIPVVSTNNFAQYSSVTIQSSATNYAYFTISAAGGGNITGYFTGGTAAGTTMPMGASVIPATLNGNPGFDIGSGQVLSGVLGVGNPWGGANGPYHYPGVSPDYGPGSYPTASERPYLSHNWSLLLDNAADAIGETIYAVPNDQTSWPNPSGLKNAASFLFTCWSLQQSAGSTASLAVTMQPYSSGGSPLAGAVTQLLYPDSATNWLQLTAAFNFAETLPSDPDHYEFILSSGPSNTSGNGVWVAQTSLSTLNNSPSLSSSGTTQVKWQSLYNTIGGGYMVRDYGTISYTDIAVDATTNTKVTSALTPFTSADVGKTLVITGGTGFTPGAYTISTVVSNVATLSASPAATSTTGGYGNRSGSGVKDFSQVGILAMACTSPIPLTDLFLRFGFVQDGTDTIAWSNDILFNATGTVAYCDISTLTGSINLADIRYLYIQAVLDLPLADIPPNTKTNVLTFGPLTSGGNLTVGQANYIYYVTETAVIDEFDSIQSNPSAGSANVIPTDGQAQAQITIPADCPKNALTTQYSLWRLGGVWDDTRLIATVGKNATVGANGANATDSTNPYYSYASGVFIDNTPDIWLTLATLISFGRDPMPTVVGAQAEWQGRRWAAVGNTLYGSWLANSDTSAGMMTTLILDTSDPNAAIEGCNFPISQDPTDTIVRLIPYGIPIEAGNAFGGGLLVLNKRSVFMVQGTDPTNFAIRQYDYDEGIGLIAQRGVARISANQLIFMGPDRLHVFPPQGDAVANDVGLRIQPALYPAYPRQQVLQNATAFAKSWMMYHDSAIYLGAPMPGDAAPSVVWKYDLRVRGWTRWTGTQVPVTDAGNSSSSSSSGGSGAIYYSQMNFTSGRSMPPNALGSPYELYFYGSGIDADGSSNGLGGQLYVMQGSIDIETPIATATAIPCTVTVHAFRPGFFYRFKLHPLYYREARLEFIEIEMILNGLLTMTAQAYNAGPSGPVAIPGAASVQQYTLTGLGQGFRKEMPSGLIEGQFVTLTLTFDCGLTQGNTTYVRGVRGHVTQTGQGAG